MGGIRHVAIVVPARDEATGIELALAAIARARCRIGPLSTTTVVVVDSRTDGSVDIVRRWCGGSRRHVEFVVAAAVGNVGAARALGTRLALAATLHGPRHVWLANTDADSEVPETWLVDQLEMAEQGAGAVAGLVERGDGATRSVDDVVRRRSRIDGPDRHCHVHGANFGVRGDAYQRCGGWQPITAGEDHDLWHRLRRNGEKVVTSTSLAVRTNARTAPVAATGREPARVVHDRGASDRGARPLLRLVAESHPPDDPARTSA